jgi:hypothetical protein
VIVQVNELFLVFPATSVAVTEKVCFPAESGVL